MNYWVILSFYFLSEFSLDFPSISLNHLNFYLFFLSSFRFPSRFTSLINTTPMKLIRLSEANIWNRKRNVVNVMSRCTKKLTGINSNTAMTMVYNILYHLPKTKMKIHNEQIQRHLSRPRKRHLLICSFKIVCLLILKTAVVVNAYLEGSVLYQRSW